MRTNPLRTATLLLTAASALLVSVGCSDTEPLAETRTDPHAAEITRLAEAVDELAASNESLEAEIRRQARQIARLTGERVDRARVDAATEDVATAAATTSADSGAEAAEETDLQSREVVDAMLETEAGQKAIAAATAREIERREAKDRRLFVSYQVGMFAQKAGLDETQTDALQGIWKRSMDRGVELRKQFAAIGKLPESEREAARTEAMQSMRDIGRSRREDVEALLSGTQLEMYEEAEEEIVAGLHGSPRR